MARKSRPALVVAVASAMLAAGCLSMPQTAEGLYRPANDPGNLGYGFTENRNADGSWTIQVRMPRFTGDALNVASSVWRRRAAALCGGPSFRETIFRAERVNAYDSYNYVEVPGDFIYAGYATCQEGAAPASEPGTGAATPPAG